MKQLNCSHASVTGNQLCANTHVKYSVFAGDAVGNCRLGCYLAWSNVVRSMLCAIGHKTAAASASVNKTVAELQTAFCRPHSLSRSSKVAIADRSKPATRAGFIIVRVVCTLLQTDNHTNTPPLWPLIVILPRASTHLNQALPTTGILCRCKNSAVAFKQRGFFRCILHYTLGKLVDRACDGRRQFITLGGHHDGAPQRVSRVRRRQLGHWQL